MRKPEWSGEYDGSVHLVGAARGRDVRREAALRAVGLEYFPAVASDWADRPSWPSGWGYPASSSVRGSEESGMDDRVSALVDPYGDGRAAAGPDRLPTRPAAGPAYRVSHRVTVRVSWLAG